MNCCAEVNGGLSSRCDRELQGCRRFANPVGLGGRAVDAGNQSNLRSKQIGTKGSNVAPFSPSKFDWWSWLVLVVSLAVSRCVSCCVSGHLTSCVAHCASCCGCASLVVSLVVSLAVHVQCLPVLAGMALMNI